MYSPRIVESNLSISFTVLTLFIDFLKALEKTQQKKKNKFLNIPCCYHMKILWEIEMYQVKPHEAK